MKNTALIIVYAFFTVFLAFLIVQLCKIFVPSILNQLQQIGFKQFFTDPGIMAYMFGYVLAFWAFVSLFLIAFRNSLSRIIQRVRHGYTSDEASPLSAKDIAIATAVIIGVMMLCGLLM